MGSRHYRLSSEVGLFSLYHRSGGREHLEVMRKVILQQEEYVTPIYEPLKKYLGFNDVAVMTYHVFSRTFLEEYVSSEDDKKITACLYAVDFTNKGSVEWDDVLIMAMWVRSMFPEEVKTWKESEFCDKMYIDYLLPIAKTYLLNIDSAKSNLKRDFNWEMPWEMPGRMVWSKSFTAHEREKAKRRSSGYATLLARLRPMSGIKKSISRAPTERTLSQTSGNFV